MHEESTAFGLAPDSDDDGACRMIERLAATERDIDEVRPCAGDPRTIPAARRPAGQQILRAHRRRTVAMGGSPRGRRRAGVGVLGRRLVHGKRQPRRRDSGISPKT